MNEPSVLLNKRIAITRAIGKTQDIRDVLERRGAQVGEYPLIRTKALTGDARHALLAAISRVEMYDWVVFTSASTVEWLIQELPKGGYDLDGLSAQIAAIGPATAAALAAHNVRVDLIPMDYRAEGVLTTLKLAGVAGKRILLPRALAAREVLPEGLRAAGAIVDVVPVYETVPDRAGAASLRQVLEMRQIDVVTFASASTVKSYVNVTGTTANDLLAGVVVACIGPITADAANKLGLHVDVVAEQYTMQGIVEALERYFSAPISDI